ncbi:FGGY family carbohydrate kinase [Variovorax sp. J22G21]|uniref:FGGY family carbohydrate kinase n=1 Tax=Variovorax fucosicus TaxID=3053517 RepID=UPI002575385F|nr:MULTISPECIES: FGGY family carbohydrate kinase [unclassified Variovorax]MDM0038250.1 FGGY family carbohydrate kinase [Variovorax sp. J22R193]MDM0063026.1 FGGY family carbohydrate kinase [Variovorax sp. J22G21]
MGDLVLAVDQGTSATKCLLVDAGGAVVAKAVVALGEHYPQPGWVEQDAEAIWRSVQQAVQQCLAARPADRVIAVGLSTQRESAMVWRRADGAPVTPLLSWQDQRTVALRDRLQGEAGVAAAVRERSGLPLDPMFSALKLGWLLDQVDPQCTQSAAGALCAGTVDAFLLARLGAGHVIEVGNASRTQLFNVHDFDWDDELLRLFRVPRAAMPQVVPSLGRCADAGRLHASLQGVPVQAVMADSHAALFAHGVYAPGRVKATLGTGSSVMGLFDGTGVPHPGLCLTVAWDSGSGPVRALEGNIRAAGSTLRWVAELFGLDSASAAELAARSDSAGVCLVPAFGGLGAPWWDANATGLLSGLTLGTGKGALLAAAVESIAHQVADVMDAMDASVPGIDRLLLDGGPSRNPHLLDLLSAAIARPVVHCTDPELSALGVAHLAGLGAGLWDWQALHALPRAQHQTCSTRPVASMHAARGRWAHAVRQSRLGSSPPAISSTRGTP